ncbi:pentapeptide repeat-containing protein [Nitrosomonas aestuarii]|uniref:pentapeptide repeat-containing protein n=1 Tax=Nitrosomonas aestuarii TaxID=52441 RepID=UPI000D2F55D5|nr:pentapeptide repeat-containing protein [Nitrosomonas aestuarii]PTN11436.1 pentapeptide repeat protein [Nitrosomonas aestuarii]
MQPETIQIIAAYIALAVPGTVAITNLAKIILEWLKQRHTISSSQIKQSHEITSHYLDRALDPSVPLAIRHQLLRFLSTPDKAGSRLQKWAEGELDRVGGIVDETNRAVADAEAEIQNARNAAEIANAERKLADAVRRQKSLLEPPASPPVTAAALKAGMVDAKELNGLSMPGEDLTGATFGYKQMRGCDFSNGTLIKARFQGCDMRATIFSNSNLENSVFLESDLRGVDFSGANLKGADFHKARLEGAILTNAVLDDADIRATFDNSTIWPDAFDPAKNGAVNMERQ